MVHEPWLLWTTRTSARHREIAGDVARSVGRPAAFLSGGVTDEDWHEHAFWQRKGLRRSGIGLIAGVSILICVTGCSASRGGTSSASSTPVLPALVGGSCPVTVSNGSTPPGEKPSPDYHGDGSLWTGLWPAGKVIATSAYVLPDGSIQMKWPWWRGVQGDLKIAGRRLDGSSPRLGADIPSGYGSTGFQASILLFPRAGCWEVTGTVGTHSLVIVTMVVKA